MDEGHQVHAFVFGLVEQNANPTLIVLYAPQSPQVLQGAADHAGNGGDGFQNDGPVAISFGEEGVGKKAQDLHEKERNPVRQILGGMVP